MAGDWIPWSKGLTRKPEVLAIAKATGLSRREAAATLMEFWEWADEQTQDGRIPAAGLEDLPGIIAGTSAAFWLAVVQTGWLTADGGGIVLPNFGYWLGRSAKRRLKKSQQKRDERERNGQPSLFPDQSSSEDDENATTVQDSTGQGNATHSPPAEAGAAEGTATNGTATDSNKPREAKRKPPDLLFDAVAEVTGTDPRASGSLLGRVCKALRDADPPYTPAEVRLLPGILAGRGMNVPPHPTTLQQLIGWTRHTPPTTPRGKAATNGRETRADQIARLRARKE